MAAAEKQSEWMVFRLLSVGDDETRCARLAENTPG